MNTIGTVDSTQIMDGERKIKLVLSGTQDVRETDHVGPAGIDHNPIRGMKAVYTKTEVEGEEVIIGYIAENEKVEPGEIRIFSQDSNGEVKFYSTYKKDGTLELGGDSDNLIRYQPYADNISAIVQFINQQLPMIAAGIATGGGSYTPGTLSVNTEPAKINEIKTL